MTLSELIGSQAYEDQNMSLPLILGKNIAGDPVIADLAPMPHLLVAGTTGSGKSVGLNCMILSLLYRMSPDECRLIMIDPKMLELSMYEDIPHLLAPVVTEPAKAIRALKWTVEQMEERYRMMASLGVRALASFNQKVRDAKAKGAQLGRRVQTGYNADTGQPVYETEELDYDVLPQIVVVVDELADLMMTAGKEVEFLIQRLAQKARAAGIHLIMATQRPSVDVITGVIKANMPTRISFQVTIEDRQPHDPRRAGRRAAAGQGRHALHARRQADHPRPRPVRQRRRGARRSPSIGASRASPITSRRSPRSPRTAAICSTASRPARTMPRRSSIARRCRSSPKARRPRPATSSGSCASATTARRG